MNRRVRSALAIATASRVAELAIPRPWNAGMTAQPIS